MSRQHFKIIFSLIATCYQCAKFAVLLVLFFFFFFVFCFVCLFVCWGFCIKIHWENSRWHNLLRLSIIVFKDQSELFTFIFNVFLFHLLCWYFNSHGHLRCCNGLQTRQANLHQWVRVSLSASFIRPCPTSKQRTS